MSYITVPEASQLTAGARDQMELFAAAHGHFSALRAVVARFPAALGALDNQYSLIMGRGRLDRWVREAVFATCSAERGDAYLAGAMAAEAVRHGADPTWVNGLLTHRGRCQRAARSRVGQRGPRRTAQRHLALGLYGHAESVPAHRAASGAAAG